MKPEISQMIESEVKQIINNARTKEAKLIKTHQEKLHFIPIEYRVFSGMIQSMNIQHGNFIQILLEKFLQNNGNYIILENLSGKNKGFRLSLLNEKLINSYITDCTPEESNNKIHKKYSDEELAEKFEDLLKNLFSNKDEKEKKVYKQDIDLLFKDKNSEKYYYLEVKFNDDHDTGKYADINRKFIKTFACLLNELPIKQHSDLVPILFYFNNKNLKYNPYIPEKTNIKRGQKFFDEFLDVDYEEVKEIFENLSKKPEIKKLFDDLYHQGMNLNI